MSDKEISDYAFDQEGALSTPDMLTMEPSMYLNYLLIEKTTRMVIQGKKSQRNDIELDLDNSIPDY
jgi:hypothetical protein